MIDKKRKAPGADFARLSRRQQCLRIAQDALEQEECEVYQMHTGFYVETTDSSIDPFITPTRVSEAEFTCRVCHLGAAALSGLRLSRRGRMRDSLNSDQLQPVIQRWFGRQQATLMEAAYEVGFVGLAVAMENDPEIRRAVGFGWEYSDEKRRSIAIWKNVIKNEGLFKP